VPRLPPRYRTPQVAPQALPTPRAATGADPNDFGASVGTGVQNVAAVLAQVAAEETRKADQAILLEAETATRHAFLDGLSGENGYLRLGGRAAFEGLNPAREAFAKRVQDVRANLGSDRQRAAYDGFAARIGFDFEERVQRHHAAAREEFGRTMFADAIKSEVEKAAFEASSGAVRLEVGEDGTARLEDGAAMRSRKALLKTIAGFVDAFGETLAVEEGAFLRTAATEAVAQMHSATLAAIYARGDDVLGAAYFAKHMAEFSYGERTALLIANKALADTGEPQTLAQREEAALGEVRRSVPEAQRAEVMSNVRSLFADKRRLAEQGASDAFKALDMALREGASLDALKMRPEWSALSAAGMRGIEKLDELRREGLQNTLVPDPEVYAALVRKGADPETRSDFLREDLNVFAPFLTSAQRSELASWQEKLAGGDADFATRLQTVDEMVQDAAEAAAEIASRGGRPASKRSGDKALFVMEMHDAIRAEQRTAQAANRPFGTREFEELRDRWLANVVYDAKWYGSNREMPVGLIRAEDIDIDDLPGDEVAAAKAALSARGVRKAPKLDIAREWLRQRRALPRREVP